MKTIEYRTMDKSSWGEGAWQSEPDKRQWADAETGMPCLIVRNNLGALCGYVGVDENHPWFEKSYDEDGPIELDAHGGLTFASMCSDGDEKSSICHLPDNNETDRVWWFGFDCAHAWDFSPAMQARMANFPAHLRMRDWSEVYRDLDYVEKECASLARQLKNVENDQVETIE